MTSQDLGQVQTEVFNDFLLIPLEGRWLQVNDGKPLVFEAKLTKDGKLELCANLSKLSHSSKEVSTNGM